MSTNPSPPDVTEDEARIGDKIAEMLFRPIALMEPLRLVNPPSWIEHIPFAFWLIEAQQPRVFVELGTHSGNSYAAFAQAVQLLGLPTACYAVDTWQGDPQAGLYGEDVYQEWSQYHNQRYSGFSRLVRSTFEEAAAHFSDGNVNLLHLDGYHTYDAVIADFDRWRPKLGDRGVVLMHDINVRERDFGAWRVWEELKGRFRTFEFLHGHGLGVVAVGKDLPLRLEWLLSQANDAKETAQIRRYFGRLGRSISAEFAARTAVERAALAEQIAQANVVDQQLLDERSSRIESLVRQVSTLDEQVRKAESERAASQAEAARVSEEMVARLAAERAESQAEKARVTKDLTARLVAERAQSQVEKARIAEELTARLAAERAQSQAETARIAEDLAARLAVEHQRRALAEQETLTLKTIRKVSNPHPSGGGLKRRSLVAARKPAKVIRSAAKTIRDLMHRQAGWTYRGLVTIAKQPRLWLRAYDATASGLFDADYYARRYPDVSASRMTPLAHFVLTGSREGRDPHALFDATEYLARNADIAGAEPLFHYLKHGALEGRRPHPLFDVSFYLEQNPDVRETRIEPLSHFLKWGAAEGRNPNPYFDCAYYLGLNADVALANFNPLIHFLSDGWREGRRTSTGFDTAYYLTRYGDVAASDSNPLVHFLESGLREGRRAVDESEDGILTGSAEQTSFVRFRIASREATSVSRPTIMCLSHVMPWPPRAGNEYRIFRMLRWFRKQGYRIVLVVAPLPGDEIHASSIKHLAEVFGNVVVCDRDGRLDYRLTDVPDVLSSLEGEFTRPISALLDEDVPMTPRERQLLDIDRTFCHDALITTVLRLHAILGSYVLFAEYVWMSRVLPLLNGEVLKVIDTMDVLSTKRDKVLQYGVDDWHVEPGEESRRLRKADIVVAIQEEEHAKLEQLVPGGQVVTASVDFDRIAEADEPSARRVLYVASDNPMNRRGLSDFLRFAWPRILQDVPDAELMVAGKVNPSGIDGIPGVKRMGTVDDLRPLYAAARVIINPAVAGTGLKIKTLEAICHFRPVVTWPNGVDGLAAELAALCTTVRDWYEFARCLVDLLRSTEPRTFSQQERDLIVRLTSADVVYGGLADVIRSRAASHT